MLRRVRTLLLFALAFAAWMGAPVAAGKDRGMILGGKILKPYVDAFNKDDEELYANIPNAEAFEFLDGNIPLLECPDKDIERTYYFRWWTYRKHVKKTPDGWVITPPTILQTSGLFLIQ